MGRSGGATESKWVHGLLPCTAPPGGDLLHTGAHKVNNALGQALMAKWLGKRPERCFVGDSASILCLCQIIVGLGMHAYEYVREIF